MSAERQRRYEKGSDPVPRERRPQQLYSARAGIRDLTGLIPFRPDAQDYKQGAG
jgi:hypothetical protein